jgi:ABC-type branched-subunit amino acid transport system substrate-binding protein
MSGSPIAVFISYSHRDEALRNELESHLAPLKRQGIITAWHDRQIKPGENWSETLDRQLMTADIVLLLVSADFMSSDFCYQKEMLRVLERHQAGEVYVIPIILRPVDWQDTPIGKLQALPKDVVPVTRWSNQDDAFVDIAKGIRKAIEDFRQQRQQQESRLRGYHNMVMRFLDLRELSASDREVLRQQQQEWQLTDEAVAAIESEVRSQMQKTRQENRHKYESRFRDALETGTFIDTALREKLLRRQQELKLTDEEVANIERLVISQINPPEPERSRSQTDLESLKTQAVQDAANSERSSAPVGLISDQPEPPSRRPRAIQRNHVLGISAIALSSTALLALIAAIVYRPSQSPQFSQPPPSLPSPAISDGQKFLLATNLPSSTDRTAGIKAYGDGDFDVAIAAFRRALNTKRNDPETLVYLNNAIAQKSNNPLKVAVAIPIQNNPDVAQEILRGVAHAQSEENCGLEVIEKAIVELNAALDCSGDIRGRKLLIQIADDQDEPAMGRQVALALAAEPSVLGVIGHRSSGVTLAVAEIYKAKGLPFISPTSSADELSRLRNPYFFRSMYTNADSAKMLNRHVQNQGYTRVAIAYAQKDSGSRSLRDNALQGLASQSFVYECDFSLGDLFNAEECIAKSEQQQADILILSPSTKYLPTALTVIDLNKGRLRLAGSDVLYDSKVIKNFGEESAQSDLVVSASWYRTNSPFEQTARGLWGDVEINWRTAMSYDATKALIQGLWNADCTQVANCREQIRAEISDPKFTADGALGKNSVRFLATGDRSLQGLENRLGGLLQVQQKPGGDYGFVPIP